jgi:hypothetical protein
MSDASSREDAMSSASIRKLNDSFRSTFVGGRVMLTNTVNCLPPDRLSKLLIAVCTFDAFNVNNDPHGEHDFGSVEIANEKFFWKIDCYDKALESASPDPGDPTVTTRVLTIMRVDEY